MGELVIVGLGPGAFGLITVETWDILAGAECLLLRTAKHPTVAELARRGIKFDSYDYLYEEKASFEEIYQAMACDCLTKAKQGKVVFAVPGSPVVAERTVTLIREQAAAYDVKLTIVPGMSFLELMYTRLGLDPITGITVVDAQELEQLPPDLNTGLVVTQVYNRQVASEAKLSLMNVYPDDYKVVFTRNLGLKDEEVRTIYLYELDRQRTIDHLTSVYVPAAPAKTAPFTLEPLTDVMATLRSPGGCVWDIEQTHESLRRYIIEEVYEVIEAIELEDADKLCEELGDLLLQIVFHARVAEECGHFSMQDVIDRVTEKMVRRHPHVFGDISVRDAAEVVVNWEAIKKQEKKDERQSVLDGVPQGLPTLMAAYKLQAKASKVGFDWDNIQPIWDKIKEEIKEVQQAVQKGAQREIESEIGDLLFAVVNLARFLDIDPESALHCTNNKFKRRFLYIENYVKAHGLDWHKLDLTQLDALWDEAKASKPAKNQ